MSEDFNQIWSIIKSVALGVVATFNFAVNLIVSVGVIYFCPQ